MMQDETRVEVVQGLTQPWADFHGDLPDYDHPLRCVFESGVQYTVELLAKELKVTDWTPCDGTEEYDGDLGGTLMNIVLAAMPKDQHGDPVHPRDLPLAFAAPPAGERVKHAWDAGYSTGQTYANDPPFAGLGKHNRQHGWELYACSLTDRNLVAHPLPADREAIARIMYERFVEENGGFFNEKNGCGFGTWDELPDKSIWLSAAGFVLALSPTPSAGRDGSE